MTMRSLPFLAALASLAAGIQAQASDFRDFRDWHAACDNQRTCSAYGFDAQASIGNYLRIERGGGPDSRAKISLTVDLAPGAKVRLRFDDPALPGLPQGDLSGAEGEGHELRRIVLSDLAPADGLIAGLRKAKTIVVTRIDPPGAKNPSDPQQSEISLSGAVAALLWIDERQKRLDTQTALIRKGDRPASAVPPPPAAPAVAAARTRGIAIEDRPAAIAAKGRTACGEEDDADDQAELQEAFALGGGKVMYMVHCRGNSGAYNMHYAFLIAPAGKPGAAVAATFDWPVKVGDTARDAGSERTVTNPEFFADNLTLRTFSKGRGIGDCGTEETWVWTGAAFRLVELRMMVHCKGVPADDWPVLYRATRK